MTSETLNDGKVDNTVCQFQINVQGGIFKPAAHNYGLLQI